MKNQMNQLLQQAQQMQQRMQDVQQQLEELEVEGSSGGGMVKVVYSGKGDVRRLNIDPSLIAPDDKEMLEDLIVAACNDARKKVEDAAAQKMAGVTGGLSLPPGMKLPF